MKPDGKQLEGLVSFVEEKLIPHGFTVETNTKVFDDDGVQVAEFDIEIRGKIGTTEIAWLIECRDRPSQGAAPGSWIEQLVGRRRRFGFNKVTAVSTTGFAKGVKEFALKSGIELREVKKLTKEAFEDWLLIKEITSETRQTILHHAKILADKNEEKEKIEALKEILNESTGETPILHSIVSQENVPFKNAFLGAVNEVGNLFDDIKPDGEAKPVHLNVNYVNDKEHFVMKTNCGSVRVRVIQFYGELRIITQKVPLIETSEYRKLENEEAISQVAIFGSQKILGHEVSLEFHKLKETGETHVILRKIK